jgi:alpha-tubulin suppressor-like RCC1 family protein
MPSLPSPMLQFVSPRSLTLVALALGLVGCPAPVTSDMDGGVTMPDAATPDAAPLADANRDAAAPVDAGPRALCTGTGCNFVEIALQGATTCARRENGQVDCWGRGQNGELGDDTMRHGGDCTVSAGDTPDCADVATTVVLPGPAVELFAEGVTSICAHVGTARELWCWGTLDWRMGSELEHDRFAPERFAIAGTPVADGREQFSSNFGHACWVEADGTASCIGRGGSGRLGQGDFDNATDPVTVLDSTGTAPLAGVVDIVAGPSHTCAWTADTLYCWGSNSDSQLGTPAPHTTCGAPPAVYDCAPLPVAVPGVDATHLVSVDLGWDHSCALLDDGRVLCWGSSRGGSLGNGTTVSTPLPTEPMGVSGVTDLEVGGGTTCVLLETGHVMCWGTANVGQIGDGEMGHDTATCIDGDGSFFDCELTPAEVLSIDDGAQLELGIGHVCVLRDSGEIWCWGNSDRFQLGNFSRAQVYEPVHATAAD